ncbi:MAG: hypothetical protein OEY64_03470 [Nitrospinota bacterium]|nr:hypothetical protein [Nitrospinota bacterium]
MGNFRKYLSTRITLSIFTAVALATGIAVYAGCAKTEDEKTTNTTYEGRLFVASTDGAHVAVAKVTIDPSATPYITVNELKRIKIAEQAYATAKTHNIHDVRLNADASKLYYSSIKEDAAGGATNGRTHVGYVDLTNIDSADFFTTAPTIVDASVDTATSSVGKLAYCASGHTTDVHIPVGMATPAYFDAIPKSAITAGATLTSGSNIKRTDVSSFYDNTDYTWAHGSSNADGSKLYLAMGKTTAGNGGASTAFNGTWDVRILKMADVTAGTVGSTSVLDSGSLTGLTAAASGVLPSMAFRSSWTPDDSKIFQAGVDRFVVFDATDLSKAPLVNTKEIGGTRVKVENHDAASTPDGKYAVLTIRSRATATGVEDGGVQLFDIANGKQLGEPVSVCNACHELTGPVTTDRKLCGITVDLTAVTK